MSVRVGHIMRNDDVHGVSGTGVVCEIFEASNGKAVVVWLTPTPSVVVYDSAKAVESNLSHGGKTKIIWDYESPPDPDPMDKILQAEKPQLTGAEIEEIAEETAAEVATSAAGKVTAKLAEKVAEQAKRRNDRVPLEDLEEEPDMDDKDSVEDVSGEKDAPREPETTGH